MLGYYLSLTLRSFRRDIVLTTLIVVLLGLGVASAMTLAAQLKVITADPIPSRSDQLYTPSVDARTRSAAPPDSEPPIQLTWTDAMALMRLPGAPPQAAMTGGQVTVSPDEGKGHSFFASARYTTAGAFPIFDIPMAAGNPWRSAGDDDRARVAVLSSVLAERLFGSISHAIGSTLRLNGTYFVVVGVIGAWDPRPHFYDLEPGAFNHAEDVFVPLSTARQLKLPTMGSMSCWSDSLPTNLETAPCAWIQFWVELGSAEQVRSYRKLLDDYSSEQQRLGRFERTPNTRLYSVRDLLDHEHVVPAEPRLQLLFAMGFLGVCILNASALILAKFLKKRPDLAVHRALGATRRSVFAQLIVEAMSAGLLGAALAMALTPLGIWTIHQQPVAYAATVDVDIGLLAATVVVSLIAATLAGIYPAWNACKIAPASFIKMQ